MDPAATSEGCRVLVCEDAEDARVLLVEMLGAIGYKVTEVARGADAIEIVCAGQIDVALIDIGLPDVNGFEVARRIRQRNCPVRLIALTGYGTASDRETSRIAGFDRHLLKPVRIDQLVAAIDATTSCDSTSG